MKTAAVRQPGWVPSSPGPGASELNSSAVLLTDLLRSVQVCFAPCWPAPFCSAEVSLVFQFSQGYSVFTLWWRGKVCSQSQRRAGLSGQKFPLLVPNWSVLMEVRTPNPHKNFFFNEVRSLNYFNTKRLGRTIALSVSTAFIALFLRVGDIKLARNSIFDNNE